jgi:hypothetical protein
VHTTRTLAVALVCLLALPPLAALAQKQQPSRLLVNNKTKATVELFVFVKDAWQSRGRISHNSSMPVYNVANGQRFRAVWGSQSSELVIKLTYDRTYGGWQQVWDLPDKDGSSLE